MALETLLLREAKIGEAGQGWEREGGRERERENININININIWLPTVFMF